MNEYTRAWRLREALKTRAPAPALALYRRWLAPRLTDQRAHVRFAGWARTGRQLRDELGTPRVSFEPDGIWVRDTEGMEWCYEPDSWMSALGKEMGYAHERAELEYVRSGLRTGGAFVDVGAHVGGYAVPVALNVDDVAIHLFEPVPATRAMLERNLARNGVADRVRIWPLAVGEAAHRTEISVADGGANRLAGRGRAGPGAIEVEVTTIDELLLDTVERVDVIKCDIEGAELPALRGAEAILRRDHPELIVEIDRRFTPRFGYRPVDLVTWLEGLGYRWERFVGDRRVPPTELDQALGEGNNFLFTPR